MQNVTTEILPSGHIQVAVDTDDGRWRGVIAPGDRARAVELLGPELAEETIQAAGSSFWQGV